MAEKQFDDVKINVEFSEEQELKGLTSGEKLSVLMGKLAKAVKDIISHLADGVKHISATERAAWNGKAAGDHTHSAMTGSTASEAGKSGLVPAPAAHKAPNDTFLASSGKWCSPFLITVQAGGDLNDYITAGFFAWSGDSLPQNAPSQNSGQLLVLRNSDNFVKQIWFRNGNLNSDYDYMVYMRTFNAGTWSNWRRFVTEPA